MHASVLLRVGKEHGVPEGQKHSTAWQQAASQHTAAAAELTIIQIQSIRTY
jgi:hypothetical protein